MTGMIRVYSVQSKPRGTRPKDHATTVPTGRLQAPNGGGGGGAERGLGADQFRRISRAKTGIRNPVGSVGARPGTTTPTTPIKTLTNFSFQTTRGSTPPGLPKCGTASVTSRGSTNSRFEAL